MTMLLIVWMEKLLYQFCTRCRLLRLFTTSVTFEINKLQQIQDVSTTWFESMPGSHDFDNIRKHHFCTNAFVWQSKRDLHQWLTRDAWLSPKHRLESSGRATKRNQRENTKSQRN
jgi:hypothetical protein